MIFYFSGTGNSQKAAKQLAQSIEDEVVSINDCMKEGTRNAFRSERPLVFVVPTYAWRMPRVVEQWIRQTEFEGARDAYFILTCGTDCGNASAYGEKLCKEKGLRFRGFASVPMPENYVALFAVPEEPECRKILEQAANSMDQLALLIQNGQPFSAGTVSLRDRMVSGVVNCVYYPFIVRDKAFAVSDSCVSCGKCASRCTLHNIEMKNGKPLWKGNCTHCMACICGCPVEAIEYGTKSKGRHRYFIFED